MRAVAIGLVLLRHGVRVTPETASMVPQPLFNLMQNGWAGVDLFLVLSGYLIGKGLFSSMMGGRSLDTTQYFIRRALRIVPAYFAVLALICLGAFPLYDFPREALGLRVAYHILFLQDYLPANINVVFWSLGVEEKFYLAAPLIALVAMKLAPARALAVLLVLALISTLCRTVAFSLETASLDYAHFFQAYRSPFHLSLEPLLFGFAIALARQSGLIKLRGQMAGRLMLTGGLGALILLSSHDMMLHISALDATLQPVLIAAFFAMGVLGAAEMPTASGPPGEPVWRVISRLSYSLYLVHFPLIPLAQAYGGGFWLPYLLLSALAALLLHFGIEKPFLSLRKHLTSPRHAPGDLPA